MASGQTQTEKGYRALATLMGPHRGMTLFKRFAKLNTHSLLVQQAEILHLETQLEAYAIVDEEQGLGYDCHVGNLLAAGEKCELDEQWNLLLKIREKLRAYNEALLQQAQLFQLPDPRPYDLQLLQDWLARPDGGNNFLTGVEDQPWLSNEKYDLVSLSERTFDTVTSWTAEKVIPWTSAVGLMKKPAVDGQEKVGLTHWRASSFHRASRVFVVFAATLMPCMAILILYFIPSMIGRILTAMALSLLFSTLLALSTSARAAEIFAATAAFAAVLVVFIGSTTVH